MSVELNWHNDIFENCLTITTNLCPIICQQQRHYRFGYLCVRRTGPCECGEILFIGSFLVRAKLFESNMNVK